MTVAPKADDCEAELVQAAQRCARMVDVLKQRGARRGRRAQLVALAAALAEVQQLGAEVCAGGWTPDERIVELTRKFDLVSAKLLEEIKPCHEKTC
jgi:hypothetical protein